MKNQRKTNWLKVTLISSIALNIVLLGGYALYMIGMGALTDIGRINTFQAYYCGEHYDAMLRSFDETQDAEHAVQAKSVYAMTVCLKNYKTGLPLNLDSLIKQVDETVVN